MDAYDVERLVRKAGVLLSESLFYYWPVANKNEIPELNITHHLSSVFLSAGLYIYGQSLLKDQGHIDLLALEPLKGYEIRVEVKKLYSADCAQKIVMDIHRLCDFSLIQDHLAEDIQKRLKKTKNKPMGLIVATTWDDNIADWWCNSENEEIPKGKTSEKWKDLHNKLTNDQLKIWGGVLLSDGLLEGRKSRHNCPEENINHHTHRLLYAIYEFSE